MKPEDLLQSFRNSYHPRIAVTVDMIDTGTDVKPLEVLWFMRTVKSRTLFEQMKGRGVPTSPGDDVAGEPDSATITLEQAQEQARAEIEGHLKAMNP